jgi:DNA repair exonuclease SbcCD ATPase subunit
VSPPFGLFKKKENNVYETKNNTTAAGDYFYTRDSLAISEALVLLQHAESEKVRALVKDLSPIKKSVRESLESIAKIADNLEHENIKLEELRFKPIVENSKRTVAASLKREASSELPLSESKQDIKKFNDRLESIMNRFGEVSNSHNRVMNIFMKKYAGKLTNEFEKLSSLLKDTKSLMSEFEEENAAITKCIDILNLLSQKVALMKTDKNRIENVYKEIEILKGKLDQSKVQLSSLEKSIHFKESCHNIDKIDTIKKEEQELHKHMLDLYSHVSRAFTRYSYGMTKDVISRLKVLTDEPWKIFDNDEDISLYTSLLTEIQKAVNSSNIKLKDSQKVLYYMDIIIKSLPKYQHEIKAINLRLKALQESKDGIVVNKATELREYINYYNSKLDDLKQSSDNMERQMTENNSECRTLVKQIEDCMFEITGKKYSLLTTNISA